jgi:heptosyltransferase-2
MHNADYNILVWLPSPMGDAILCTPALRAIRNRFSSSRITFLADPAVRSVLSPCSFNDAWLPPQRNPVALAAELKAHKFTHAILFKNSFAAVLAVFLARIPNRVGYAREMRGPLLTDKLHPPRLPNGKFKPLSMLDYYLAIAERLGADTTNRSLELQTDKNDSRNLHAEFPDLVKHKNPVVVLVPGGAFGPSKCWPGENFAKIADWLVEKYNAVIVISVAPNPPEKKIAAEICALGSRKLLNLAEHPLELGELKALFSLADLVITNDTGPRHIAIPFKRKLITLFGPNDPAWTDTDYENEIQIVGNVPCAPCAKPICRKPEHLCMLSITPDMVRSAAEELLAGRWTRATVFTHPQLEKISESFFINTDYKAALTGLGLTSIDAVFTFSSAKNLAKSNLAPYRSRLQFDIGAAQSLPPTTVFLKRYDNPPILVQLKNWLSHRRRISCASCEVEPIRELPAAGVCAPKVIAYGWQWGALFEKRSFIITEKIPDADALERKLPHCFNAPPTTENLKSRRDSIARFAAFIKRFHHTGYCHRDLYFSHIFYRTDGTLCLIDLARAFKPLLMRRRFLIKDIAQIHYSAPAACFSMSDRLRFYLAYTARNSLTRRDKAFIRKILAKTNRMAEHDRKHGRCVPFAR